MSTSIAAAVTSLQMDDLSDETVQKVLLAVQRRRSLSNTEIECIKGAVKRAKEYKKGRNINGICTQKVCS